MLSHAGTKLTIHPDMIRPHAKAQILRVFYEQSFEWTQFGPSCGIEDLTRLDLVGDVVQRVPRIANILMTSGIADLTKQIRDDGHGGELPR